MKTADQLRKDIVGHAEFKPATPHQPRPAAGRVKPKTEAVEWQDASLQLPDSDTTVLVHCPISDDPVWLGYHDGEHWRSIDGQTLDDKFVDHWADLPEGPKS